MISIKLRNFLFIAISIPIFVLVSCEKEIEVELPPYSQKIIVEGWIEYNDYATVFITKSADYFAEFNEQALMDMIITDAVVVVSDASGLKDTLQIGIDTTLAFPIRYKGSKIKGNYGSVYHLNIYLNNKEIKATTTIPQPFTIDTVFYVEQIPEYKKGILRMKFTDEPGVNNYYRFFSMISGKHHNFIPAFGATFDDKFFNGIETYFDLFQGRISNIVSQNYHDDTLSYLNYYFGDGDTVIYKYTTIDFQHYQFWYTADWIIQAGDNPFISPAPIRSNISGAMGVWGGYASRIDTFIVEL